MPLQVGDETYVRVTLVAGEPDVALGNDGLGATGHGGRLSSHRGGLGCFEVPGPARYSRKIRATTGAVTGARFEAVQAPVLESRALVRVDDQPGTPSLGGGWVVKIHMQPRRNAPAAVALQ
jgi:hypothetical protein